MLIHRLLLDREQQLLKIDGLEFFAILTSELIYETIGKNIRDYCVVVTKSTVPVGTHEKVCRIIRQHTDVPFDYVSNPEFLKEGSAVDDFLRPERVIIGTDSQRARKIMEHLYEPFMRQRRRILFMTGLPSALVRA